MKCVYIATITGILKTVTALVLVIVREGATIIAIAILTAVVTITVIVTPIA